LVYIYFTVVFVQLLVLANSLILILPEVVKCFIGLAVNKEILEVKKKYLNCVCELIHKCNTAYLL